MDGAAEHRKFAGGLRLPFAFADSRAALMTLALTVLAPSRLQQNQPSAVSFKNPLLALRHSLFARRLRTPSTLARGFSTPRGSFEEFHYPLTH